MGSQRVGHNRATKHISIHACMHTYIHTYIQDNPGNILPHLLVRKLSNPNATLVYQHDLGTNLKRLTLAKDGTI